jgi:quinol-cytochrome oxidoreductase complex cytochrome b subunit/cytochrome c553
MRTLLAWIDDRTGLGSLMGSCLDARIPGRACWCRVWPAAMAFAFCVQVITGFFIWIYYSPSTQTAWESVYFLQYQVAGGWLLRAMHHWSGQVLLVLVGLYLIQMIVTGAYRAPRELVFWTVVLMALVTLGLLLTGDLLAWDQNSVASTQVRVGFLELLPWVGNGLYKLAVGGPGPQFGQLTLPRFLALHICCLSGSLFFLLLLHALALQRADAAKAAAADESVPWWPRQAVFNATAMLLVLVVILLLSVRHGLWGDDRGAQLGSPADTSSFYAAARPEWAFLGLYQFARLFPGGKMEILPIFIIPGVLLVVVLTMPWIARLRGGHWFNLCFTGVLLVGVVTLSFVRVWKDLHDKEHQAALASEAAQARRAVELARGKGIPATGALTLLRHDPKTQGPILFKTYCAACHDHVRTLEVSLAATHGTLSLGETKRLNFTSGAGADQAHMTFIAGLEAANRALEGLTFKPKPDYNGPASLSIEVRGKNHPRLHDSVSDTLMIAVGKLSDPSTSGQPSRPAAIEGTPAVLIDAAARFLSTGQNTPLVFSSENDSDIRISDPNPAQDDIWAEESSAPNLYRFAHRSWLTGLLDPKQIQGPHYFGNTALRAGQMPGFVKEILSDLDELDKQELETTIFALSAEAALRSQHESDAEHAEKIKEGRKLLLELWDCVQCHKFYEEKGAGNAPDLTRYGSREWIKAIVSNPADKRFYGDRNDRMPAYGESLSDREIELLSDWLRGEWYEP